MRTLALSLCCWVVCLSALAAEARAQAQNDPCRPGVSNGALRQLAATRQIPRLRGFEDVPWMAQRWASSTRVPPPNGPPPRADDDFDVRMERARESCRFSAASVQDDDTRTCWCEGALGDGMGEIVIAAIEPETDLGICVGDGGSDSAFAAVNRPQRVWTW